VSVLHSHDNDIVWLAGASRRSGLLHRLAELARSAFARVESWLAERSRRRRVRAQSTIAERLRQRRVLATLSDRDLKDIGVSRYDVEVELRKPFWR